MFRAILVLTFLLADCWQTAHSVEPTAPGCMDPIAQGIIRSYTNKTRYSEAVWLTSHNAFANLQDGWKYVQQSLNIPNQFAIGARSFMIDLHWYTPDDKSPPYLALCHDKCKKLTLRACPDCRGITSVFLPTPALTLFKDIRSLLEANPQDIITLHIESYTDEQPNSAKAIYNLLEESGLNRFLLPNTIDPNSHELSLGQMRQNNHRLVAFSDRDTDLNLHPAKTFTRENDYNLKDNKMMVCGEMRGDRDASGQNPIFVFNHFYLFSEATKLRPLDQTNDYHWIMKRIEDCYQREGLYPNFIAGNFIETGINGGLKAVVLELNQHRMGLGCSNSHPGVADVASETATTLGRLRGNCNNNPTHFLLARGKSNVFPTFMGATSIIICGIGCVSACQATTQHLRVSILLASSAVIAALSAPWFSDVIAANLPERFCPLFYAAYSASITLIPTYLFERILKNRAPIRHSHAS